MTIYCFIHNAVSIKKLFLRVKHVILLLSASCFISLSGISLSDANSELENDETSVGELFLTDQSGHSIPSLLLNTDIKADINGLIATITVKQHFKNDSEQWVNGRYVFPLPENGAIDGMLIKVGDRIIKGTIKEKESAKKVFEAAKSAGKKAALLEQHRPNLFSMTVANIPPNSEVITEIRVIDSVQYKDNQFSLRMPTTITPRYIPGKSLIVNLQEEQDVQINHASGWGINTDIVADASLITPPQTHAEEHHIDHHFSLKLNLHAGVELTEIGSSTHAISINHHESKPTIITLKNGTEKMDQDLRIEWKPVASQSPRAALFQQMIADTQFSMAMLLPPTIESALSIPKEITFIIDSSGSMAGHSMKQAKKSLYLALERLNPNDRFNIVDFDSHFTSLFELPQIANAHNIWRARSMVRQLRADGGTEMFGPLDHALSMPTNKSYLKQVIFITDGSVGNEQQLFKLINDKLGDARLFTIGIGSAPNSHFMNKAAQFGKGSFTYINSAEETVEKMSALFHKITRPVARDLIVSYPDTESKGITVEQFPKKIPDIYAGEPLLIFAKSNKAVDKIEISGQLLGKTWKRTLMADVKKANNAENLDAIWARRKVDHLMDNLVIGAISEELAKPEIIQLGIEHHLMTKYTSFVAVEKHQSKPDHLVAKNKNIANLMPKGSTMIAPQTATPADLLAILGALLMLLSLTIRQTMRTRIVI